MPVHYQELSTRRVPTTAEVYSSICTKHFSELTVFSSYSAPDGDRFGNPSKAVMMTEWGFNGCPIPLIGHKRTWDIGDDARNSEQVEYWLCVAVTA